MSKKEALRSLTVGAKKNFRTKLVEYGGSEFEVRQLSVKGRQSLFDKATKSDGTFDNTEFLVWAVITCTYVPGTEEKVFNEADYESLINQPSDSFVDTLGNAASDVLNTEGN